MIGWEQGDDDCVAVVIDEEDDVESWRPVTRRLADAINAGKIAGFNLVLSLGARERALLAPLYDR